MSRGSTQDAGGNAYSMVRYLLSKQALDDRSLNSHVLRALSDWLGKQHSPRILEIGAGVGTMITRLVSTNALSRGHYALLDADAHSLAAAREHLTEWALARQLVALSTEGELGLQLRGADVDISVEFIEADAARFCVSDGQPGFDLLVANSVLDLMDLNVALPALWRLCNPHAAYWFTLNFDGETIFLPEHAHDAPIIAAYHATMDERVVDGRASGHSQTGRRLLQALLEGATSVVEAGSSDWVLFPQRGTYVCDERYFLDHILHFVEEAVRTSAAVSPDTLLSWLQARRADLAAGRLTYIAKQMDVFGLAPPSETRQPTTTD